MRQSKHDPLVDEVKLLDVTPCYARVEFPNGRVDTVSLKHLAPLPLASEMIEPHPPTALPSHQHASPHHYVTTPCDPHQLKPLNLDPLINEAPTLVEPNAPLRVSTTRP